jgi:mannose-1-phosphate guanylyltransferase
MLHALIMAGGAGTRFWPASRRRRPKQLLKLAGDRSMIQATIDRLGELVAPDRVMILTNEVLTEAIGEQLPELPVSRFSGNHVSGIRLPCVALAAALMAGEIPRRRWLCFPPTT